jgi:carbon monoxide dehydrogenase subunit G
MELDHEFTVPVPVDQAWPVLLDVERIAPCMPGATLDSVDGEEFTGRLRVKLGAMTITYKGSARIASRDDNAHTVTIEGMGKEARGSGTASATVQAQLHAEGDQTRVTVHTKLNITGRPAQFGRNIMAEVGGKLIGRFAGNLAKEITSPAAEAEPKTAGPNTAPKTAEPERAPKEPKAAEPKAAEPKAAEPKEQPETAEPKAAAKAGEAPAEPTAPAKPAKPTETVSGNGAPKAVTPSETPVAPVEPGTNGDGTPTPAERAPEKPEPPEKTPSPRAAEKTPSPTPQAAPETRPTAPETRPAAPRSENEPIDLLEFAGPSLAKRLAPVVAALASLWVVRRLIRRKRR